MGFVNLGLSASHLHNFQDKESLITELRKELRVSDEEHRELLSRVNADDMIRRIRSDYIISCCSDHKICIMFTWFCIL